MRRWAAVLPALLALAACPHAPRSFEAADRAAIHALLVNYGRTRDARDFEGFATLFGTDGVYIAGTGAEVRGPEAAAMMRRVFAENALGFREPNYHLFFDEVVTFTGPDSARATSRSLYMVPDEGGAPTPAMMAEYADDLVRHDGRWTFARRVVKALLPAPRSR